VVAAGLGGAANGQHVDLTSKINNFHVVLYAMLHGCAGLFGDDMYLQRLQSGVLVLLSGVLRAVVS
jgi:hypothetical protein